MMDPKTPDIVYDHSRRFKENRLVYPVLSRRSRGVSVGVNLTPDKRCNFNCRYCQVHREALPSPDSPLTGKAFAAVLKQELIEVLNLAVSGELFTIGAFAQAPPAWRRLNDIALSGDGEPTAADEFLAACQISAAVKEQLNQDQLKLVLITNASLLHQPQVQQGLELLDAHNGEIWAKLDAGTAAYYQYVNRSAVPFERIVENIILTARKRPVIIQTLFACIAGEGPGADEVAAYKQRLREIRQKGGSIKEIHLLTVARPPAESDVTPMPSGRLEQLANDLQTALNMPVQVFPG